MEYGALSGSGIYGDGAAVLFHDGFGNVEAQTAPSLLLACGEGSVEEFFLDVLGDSAAVVTD